MVQTPAARFDIKDPALAPLGRLVGGIDAVHGAGVVTPLHPRQRIRRARALEAGVRHSRAGARCPQRAHRAYREKDHQDAGHAQIEITHGHV